jgi:quinol monooxygenase YgiN
MFARIVRFPLKPGQGDAYARAIDEKIIPILKKHRGFRDEIALVSPDGSEGIGISLWERQEDAEAYHREAYEDIRKMLEPFLAGTPEVSRYRLTTSTAHAIAAK